MSECTVDDCTNQAMKAGRLCWTHYAQMRDARAARCTVDGCDKPGTGGQGYCRTHYSRWRRHGSPLTILKTGRKPAPPKPPPPVGSQRGQLVEWRTCGPEHAVALPGVEPVRCDACGQVVCADPTSDALYAARANHDRYCTPPKRRKQK